MNHYEWLEKNLPDFFEKAGVKIDYIRGLLSAHGDKFYGYKYKFDKEGLHFFHGVAIGLLTYVHPYGLEVRETKNGWVAPIDWIIQNKDRFLKFLPPVEENDYNK